MDVVVDAVKGLHPTMEDVAKRFLTAATATAGLDREPRQRFATPPVLRMVGRWSGPSTLGGRLTLRLVRWRLRT